ncbi:DUF87 domain-containing protein [Micromonospora sp. DH14]|uniref:helicase HerA domain-containing protein n=1 Tax=Micromonospora sp. DH14 TaxID=3040120 RepID=UPI0024424240|nr:DUF87 domain-containing protein [Micromonospora sp. DH14]
MSHRIKIARQHTVPRLVYRFLAGRPMDGKPRTDATYLHRGTEVLPPYRRARRWMYRPGWQRQAFRLGTPTGAAAVAYSYVTEPTLTQAGAGTVAATVAARAAIRGRRRIKTRKFRRVYTQPLAAALAPVLRIPEHTRPEQWLTVSPELAGLAARLVDPMSPAEIALRRWYGEHIEPGVRYVPDRLMKLRWWAADTRPALAARRRLDYFRRPSHTKPARVEIEVAGYVTPELQKIIRQTITAKLPLGDLVESWDQVGTHAVGMWTVRERPPRSVGFAEIEPYLDSLKDDEFLLGLRAGGRPYVVSLNSDSPHLACSAGSGAGKSVLAMLIGVQVLSRGGRVLIIDRKGSHRWALGLPGVTYCTEVQDMHSALIGTSGLADERNREALTQPEDWNPGDRVLVIFEEMNATVAQLKAYWEELRGKEDPKTSPAIQAFRNIMFMGRSAKVHLFGVAQMLTANTTGGPESRENFGIRALARYTANNWKMLAPECPMPRRSGVLGRWQIVVAGNATEVQVAYLEPEEARAIATVGRPIDLENSPGVPVSPLYARPGDDQVSPGSVPGTGQPTGDTPPDPLNALLTLREAVNAGIVPGQFDAAKKRLQRARKNNPEFAPAASGKKGLADTYRVGDLIEWVETESKRAEFKK